VTKIVAVSAATRLHQKAEIDTFSKHAEVVKSSMRVLDGREQVTVSGLMLKLRKGDVVKFVRRRGLGAGGEGGTLVTRGEFWSGGG
jgi:hypothetical protein